MKKILLLFTSQSLISGAANATELCAVLNNASAGSAYYEYATYGQLTHFIGRNTDIQLPDGRSLTDYDAVYQRRWQEVPEQAMAVAIFLNKRGVPCVDTEAAGTGSRNKLTQHWRMWEQDIPGPQTGFLEAKLLRTWVDENLQSTFSLPCIMKSTHGTRGGDNYLVHTVEEALEIVETNSDMAFLVQEFIPNDGDYRAFVCGDAVALTIRRKSSAGSHKNNTSLGGSARLVSNKELSVEVQQTCV